MDPLDALDAPEGALATNRDRDLKLTIGLLPADGTKCERCWHYSKDVSSSGKYPGCCPRCVDALTQMFFPAVELPDEQPAQPAPVT